MAIDKQVVPDWCKADGFPEFDLFGCGQARGFDRKRLIASAWAGYDADAWNTGQIAFGYLWRRFGPPSWGSDNHKELCQYVIATPDPCVLFTLGIKAMPLSYSVGFLMGETLGEIEDPAVSARVCIAVEAAMEEMLRPVYIRDVPINIFGRVADSEADGWYPANPSRYAGYGVPLEAMDEFIKKGG